MPATEYQGFSVSPLLVPSTRGGNQAQSMETAQEAFDEHVAERLEDLSAADDDELLTIPWILKVLNVFLCCQDEFKSILLNNKAFLKKPPMERYVSEYFEKSVKGLDVFNVIRDGIERIRQWQKLLEIVVCALDNQSQRSLGEAQFRRAKKALIDLAICMLDNNNNSSANKAYNLAAASHRNRSFGRNNAQKDQRSMAQFRSLSWSVSQNWSAARQLQAMANSQNLVPPRSSEIVASNGFALVVFTMSYVLYFVMWALVAAIPCQDRSLHTHFFVANHFLWAAPLLSLHDRILEESKRKERKNSCGLLKEIHGIEKCARYLNELTDSVQFPLSEEQEKEVKERVDELKVVCDTLKEQLDPLERQVREAFHTIVRCRVEGFDSMGQTSHQ
ncbi:PREDICTED: uncharacterized protein LOC109151388 [Ipomoea nil]|uniref:uncharacterized protein LOC109151388 n=1 Tax=Ipomoea nil TaxID=35883 RepID=UPI000901646A|nr:PREDICTED: uncharacterized protein LOC109151388 [Ipomoea nil]XP_019154942.1 PREDICTED: uncharacterized protein LOC109151388 [Ipomoea nil]